MQHPETPASVTSPRLTVGATHGRGSESIAGPQQDQHHPLQRTTARPSVSSASLNASPASPVDEDGLRSARSSRTALNSHQLTPTQLAFVRQLESRLTLKADRGSRATGGTGEAGVDRLSPRVGSECGGSPGGVSSARPQPLAATQHQNELEILRCRLNEREEQLVKMTERIGRITQTQPGSATTATRQGGFGPIKGDGTSPETGALAFPQYTSAPATERSPPAAPTPRKKGGVEPTESVRPKRMRRGSAHAADRSRKERKGGERDGTEDPCLGAEVGALEGEEQDSEDLLTLSLSELLEHTGEQGWDEIFAAVREKQISQGGESEPNGSRLSPPRQQALPCRLARTSARRHVQGNPQARLGRDHRSHPDPTAN